jgi:hypothetical protein
MILLIYLLTAIGLTPGGSSTVYIYTQTIHRTTQLRTLTTQLTTLATQLTTLTKQKLTTLNIGRLSEIQTQSGQTKINVKLTA